jgi:peptidyl-prolyl cis-trans isomerase B (cyclophilin B)
MKYLILFLIAGLPLMSFAAANPKVVFETSKGKIVVEVFTDKAPITAKNFLTYVDEKFFDGTIFHRVIPNFVVQGGGLTKDMKEKPTHDPITNEADNGLSNSRGTLCMARTNEPHSATSQFFVNLVDNKRLDYTAKTDGRSWGYAVFGKVVEGMDVVDAMAQVPTGNKTVEDSVMDPQTKKPVKTTITHQNVPMEPITVLKSYRLK